MYVSHQSVIGWTQFCYLILSASEASYWSHKITVLCTVVILAPLLATYSSVTVQIYPSKNESTHTGRQDSPQMKILAVHKSYCSLLPWPGYWCSVSDFKKLDKFIFRQLCCDIKLAQPWVWRSRSWLCSLSPPTTPGTGQLRSSLNLDLMDVLLFKIWLALMMVALSLSHGSEVDCLALSWNARWWGTWHRSVSALRGTL